MNNNYGSRMTDNYKVLLNLLKKNEEFESSSEDSAFDSEYDERLDDSFNRMIKEAKNKKLVKKENSTFTENEVLPHSPTENAATSKERDGALELHRGKSESTSTVDSPNFLPSLNSTMCSSVIEISDVVIKQENSSLVAHNECVREENVQQVNFLPQGERNGMVDLQNVGNDDEQVREEVFLEENSFTIQQNQLPRNGCNGFQQTNGSFVANNESVHGFDEEMLKAPEMNSTYVAHNQSDCAEGTSEMNSTYVAHNQSDGAEGTPEMNSTYVAHNQSDGQEEIENEQIESLNSTITIGNESSWIDCDDSWADCDSSACNEVFQ